MGHGIEFPVKNDDVVRCAVCVGNNRNEWTTTTRENACNRETIMKFRAVITITFAIAQVALAREHASRRSVDIAYAVDRAIRCNRNIGTQTLSAEAQEAKTHID